MSEARKEAWVGCALIGGLVLAGIGLVLTLMLYMGGATALLRRQDPAVWALRGLGPGLILLGLLASSAALLYGIREGRKTTTGKGAVMDPDAKVMARYAYDKTGDLVVDDWLFDERDGLKFYVKLELTGGTVREFQCSRQIHGQCGEGMRGAATFDGKWLGGFAPNLGGGQSVPWQPRL